MTYEEATAVELLPGVTIGNATPEQWEEHSALCERMSAWMRTITPENFNAAWDTIEAWNKRLILVNEAAAVLVEEAKRRGVLK